ncbi:IS4 family transposase [Massilia antarctica]|uniref:IS4 family transposase n=1 Tax=Massilia antarctica TaxID=2765360 RepID=A0AA49A9Q4_9BURK|nr:IS4 family transposase [Massilia antarctica]QPI51694.1 IS4 family transposase [Massilia antarctica]
MGSRLRALLSGIKWVDNVKRVAGIGLRGLTSVCQLKNQTCNMFSITTFQRLMKGLPRGTFAQLVERHNADKYCKKFGHWDHLIAMLYAQISEAKGLRPLETGFNSHVAHHYHLGTSAIKRSTLADANENRSDTVFSDTAAWLMGKVSRKLRQQSNDLMYLLDSTSLTLKGREFERWTPENSTRNTQGLKLHVLYDAHDAIPVWHDISHPNVNDVERAVDVPLEANALYVFDKGYCDFNWWKSIDEANARFVTRFKNNAAVNVLQKSDIPADDAHIVLSDEIVTFKHKRLGGKRINLYFGKPLRRVIVARPNKDTPIVLATNDFDSSAMEIAQHYKKRWAIELFFKWIKQHLKIKQFLGRSENAVRIQILTALISYLLVALFNESNRVKRTLWDCLCFVRATLFQRTDTEDLHDRRRRQAAHEFAEIQGCLFS